ncbi:MAG: hypothetical protein ACK5MQ_17130 [Pikeienuella sp.]
MFGKIVRNAVPAVVLAAAVAVPAGADEARLAQGLDQACLALAGDPLHAPARMSESFYWTFRQAPSLLDFRMIRDDTQIFLSITDAGARCVVTDLRAPPTAALIETVLERRFPGAWAANGGAWSVSGETPLAVRLTETESGAGVAVETGS